MAVQASRRQKRQAKKVKEASRKRAITESNIGRVQFGRSISSIEWGCWFINLTFPYPIYIMMM